MLRHNLFACARDTSEGVRKPRVGATSRTRPSARMDSSDGVPPSPLALGGAALGANNPPVVTQPRGEKDAGSPSGNGTHRGMIQPSPESSVREYDGAAGGVSDLKDSVGGESLPESASSSRGGRR